MMVMVNNTSLYGRFGNIIIILYRNILVEYCRGLGDGGGGGIVNVSQMSHDKTRRGWRRQIAALAIK